MISVDEGPNYNISSSSSDDTDLEGLESGRSRRTSSAKNLNKVNLTQSSKTGKFKSGIDRDKYTEQLFEQ